MELTLMWYGTSVVARRRTRLFVAALLAPYANMPDASRKYEAALPVIMIWLLGRLEFPTASLAACSSGRNATAVKYVPETLLEKTASNSDRSGAHRAS